MSGLASTAGLVAAGACALVAGVFFAFSTFVMQGLDRLPADRGIAAMQQINKTAVTPLFMTALMGTALACVALGVWALLHLDEPAARWVLAGCALYLVGCIGLTIGYHVPRNDALATISPGAPDAADTWSTYVTGWTALNHVRCVAALGASALLTVATRVG